MKTMQQCHGRKQLQTVDKINEQNHAVKKFFEGQVF